MPLTSATPSIESYILTHSRLYKNHPHANQSYLDFFPLLSSPSSLELVISAFVSRIVLTYNISSIAAIVYPEAQGFILGPLIASRLHLPSVAVRKPGKLAGDVWICEFGKWGEARDSLEMQRGAFDDIALTTSDGTKKGAIIVDDSVATGGSVGAVKKILDKRWEIPVLEIMTIIEATWEEFSSQQDENGLKDVKIFALAKLTEENMGKMKVYDGRRDEDGKRLAEQ